MFGGKPEQFSGYGAIGGELPWNSADPGGAFKAAALPPDQALSALGDSYQGAYNSALAQNQSNYNNILAGYQKTLASQTSAQQAISAGYSNLYNQVQDKLATQGQTRATDITAAGIADLGRQTQGLVDRGLGNTTVQNQVVRGNAFDRERQLTANSEAVSGLQATSARELGLAGLGFQQNAMQANTSLQNRQLDWMNSINAQYPSAGMYGQLATQIGQNAQQQRNAALAAQLAAQGGGGYTPPQLPQIPQVGAGNKNQQYAAEAPPMLGSTGPRSGYVPSSTPSYGGGSYNPAGSGSGYVGSPGFQQSQSGYVMGPPSAAMSGVTGAASSIASGFASGFGFEDYGGGGDFGPSAGVDDILGMTGDNGSYLPADYGQYWDDYQ